MTKETLQDTDHDKKSRGLRSQFLVLGEKIDADPKILGKVMTIVDRCAEELYDVEERIIYNAYSYPEAERIMSCTLHLRSIEEIPDRKYEKEMGSRYAREMKSILSKESQKHDLKTQHDVSEFLERLFPERLLSP